MTWNIDINRNRCFFIIHTRIFLMKYIWRKNRSNISMEEKAYRFANVRKKTQWLFQNRDFKAELYRRFLLDHYSIHCSTDNIESTIGQSRAQQITAEIEKIKEEFEKNENQLKIDSENFKEEKQIDVFRLNIDEEISMTTREKPYSNLKIFFFLLHLMVDGNINSQEIEKEISSQILIQFFFVILTQEFHRLLIDWLLMESPKFLWMI